MNLDDVRAAIRNYRDNVYTGSDGFTLAAFSDAVLNPPKAVAEAIRVCNGDGQSALDADGTIAAWIVSLIAPNRETPK